MPPRKRRQRIRQMRIDRLSELPDPLLIHILSFMDVKRAGITSVLSKRWKSLWSESPTLEFCHLRFNFVRWINRTIDIRKGNYLEKFMVDFRYYIPFYASDVDSWVEFSVKNKVKEFILNLYNNRDTYNYYTLQLQLMYSCSSLTTLKLMGCNMPYKGTIGWQPLTELDLSYVKLNQHLLDEILSSCPVLNNLKLRSCSGFNRLEANFRCLNSHEILDEDRVIENEPLVEISVPYVRILNIVNFLGGRKWQLRSISSVVTASIGFYTFYGDYSVEVMDNVKEFLENCKHVNDLHLTQQFFEVDMEEDGWQLPQFRLRHLKIDFPNGYDFSIPGIICMLESSPDLETLLLNGSKMKVIRVNNFPDENGEPLLTLARILLRRAPTLEEMVIIVDTLNTDILFSISQKLLTRPRSSTKAEIRLFDKLSEGLNF